MGWTGSVPISRDGLIDLQELPHASANKAARSRAPVAAISMDIGNKVFHPIGPATSQMRLMPRFRGDAGGSTFRFCQLVQPVGVAVAAISRNLLDCTRAPEIGDCTAGMLGGDAQN